MVKSTDSGLAVPDWPLSYGMLFPPMVGGVFYEHGHRMVATVVGLLTLCLAIWLGVSEQRRWVRHLGFCALGAVILQGVLGGVTVLFFLPVPISVIHGVLAQIFFILTIIIAYSLSDERRCREFSPGQYSVGFLKLNVLWIILVFLQLILGAVMRHTESGLAVPDFPKMGGYWIPPFNKAMMGHINDWRFENNFDPVTRIQVIYHFLHRVGALVVLIVYVCLRVAGRARFRGNKIVSRTFIWLDLLLGFQIFLGAMTVLTMKSPRMTSLHVVTGAAILGVAVLLFLRAAPLLFNQSKKQPNVLREQG